METKAVVWLYSQSVTLTNHDFVSFHTQAEIQKALEQVCDIMPDTIKLQCKDFVDQYAPAIIELLAQELSPDLVCSTLGLCTNKAVKPVKHQPVKGIY